MFNFILTEYCNLSTQWNENNAKRNIEIRLGLAVEEKEKRLSEKPLLGGISIYFFGTLAKTAFVKVQNFSMEAMFTRSSGEWGDWMVGPNEIMSQFG